MEGMAISILVVFIIIGYVVSTDLNVRLIPGPDEGRLEVFYQGAWGTVCYHLLKNQAASVVCRSLNQPEENAYVVTGQHFLPGQLKSRISEVSCLGREATLFDCLLTNVTDTNISCYVPHVVGIVCTDKSIGLYLEYRGRPFPFYQKIDIFEHQRLLCRTGPTIKGLKCNVSAMRLSQQGKCAQHIPLTRSNQGTLNCTASNWQMPIAGDLSVDINILYKPTLKCQRRYNVTKGSKVSINCDVSANPLPDEFTWTNSSGNIVYQGSEPSLVIDSVGPQNIGRYWLTASNVMKDSYGQTRSGIGTTEMEIIIVNVCSGCNEDPLDVSDQPHISEVPRGQMSTVTFIMIGVLGTVSLFVVLTLAVVIMKLRNAYHNVDVCSACNEDPLDVSDKPDISEVPQGQMSTITFIMIGVLGTVSLFVVLILAVVIMKLRKRRGDPDILQRRDGINSSQSALYDDTTSRVSTVQSSNSSERYLTIVHLSQGQGSDHAAVQ